VRFLLDDNLHGSLGFLTPRHTGSNGPTKRAQPNQRSHTPWRTTGVQSQALLIQANLRTVADELDNGAIVVLGEATVRIRRLPSSAHD